MKLLLIRFSALGDVAMLAPIVKEYATTHPDDSITVMSKPFCAPLFDEIAPNVDFLGADIKGEYRGIRGLLKLFHRLERMRFDRICDMHDVLRTKFLRKLFTLRGYKVCHINKHRSLRRLITAPYPKKQLRQLPTSFENYRECLYGSDNMHSTTAANTSTTTAATTSPLSPSSCSHKAIGIAPFAAHDGKIYPIDRTERIIKIISDTHSDYTIILFGGGGNERDIMENWEKRFPRVITARHAIEQGMAGDIMEPSLRGELHLMRNLCVMLSMDSANMHLASLVGTRVVSVWGATHPYAGFLGWRQSIDDCVQRNDLKCRPCSIYGNRPCIYGDMKCMDISPEEIAKKLCTMT